MGWRETVSENQETVAARDLCWSCESEVGGEYFCDSCIKIQPVSKDTDYFKCVGLPRLLNIDLEDLERRFYELSRKIHPDYFQQKTDQEKAISLQNSAVLNTAYRTLRDPIRRAEYIVRLEEGAAKAIPTRAPADLFEEILEFQEVLEEYKHAKTGSGPEKEGLLKKVKAERVRLDERKKTLEVELKNLFEAWDELADSNQSAEKPKILLRIKEILSNRSYLETVLHGIRQNL